MTFTTQKFIQRAQYLFDHEIVRKSVEKIRYLKFFIIS